MGLKQNCQDPLSPFSPPDRPSQNVCCLLPARCTGLPLRTGCPPSSGLQSQGWGSLGSSLQGPAPALLPHPLPSSRRFNPDGQAWCNSLPVLPLPALTQKCCQAPGGPTAPPSRGPGLGLRLWVSGLPPPLPSDGPRQLHAHWVTRGGGIWSQREVGEPPPFPGRPAWSSVSHLMAGTGLGPSWEGPHSILADPTEEDRRTGPGASS